MPQPFIKNIFLGELKPRLTNLLQDKDPAEQDNIIFQVSWINIFLNQV